MQIIGSIKLIDIFFITLCLRISYIAASRGIIKEIFKITGNLTGAFFAFHYYSFLAQKIEGKISFLNGDSIRFLSFFFIFLGCVFFSAFLSKFINLFFKREEIPLEEKLITLLMGIFRFIFFASIFIFSLALLPIDRVNYQESVSYRIFRNVAPWIYLGGVEFYSRVNKKVTVNEEVKKYYEVKRSLSGSSEQGF